MDSGMEREQKECTVTKDVVEEHREQPWSQDPGKLMKRLKVREGGSKDTRRLTCTRRIGRPHCGQQGLGRETWKS